MCKKAEERGSLREGCRKQMEARESGFVPSSCCHDSQASKVLRNCASEVVLSYGRKRGNGVYYGHTRFTDLMNIR